MSKNSLHEKNLNSGFSPIPVILLALGVYGTACGSILSQTNSEQTYLGTVGRAPAVHLAWSPAGEKIAVTSYSDVENFTKISLLDIRSGQFQPVLETSYGILSADSWSPDGKQILFSSAEGGKDFGPGIWLSDITGNIPPRYIAPGHTASWSPHGGLLAIFEFVPGYSAGDISLHILDLNTSEDTVVYETRGKYIGGLSWSPNESDLAFALAQEGNLDAVNIYKLSITSGELVQFTTSGRSASPIWSPDGNLIAYVTEEPGEEARLHLQDSDASCGVTVPNLRNISDPTWSPDGIYIGYIGEFGGVYKLDLSEVFGDRFLSDGIICP